MHYVNTDTEYKWNRKRHNKQRKENCFNNNKMKSMQPCHFLQRSYPFIVDFTDNSFNLPMQLSYGKYTLYTEIHVFTYTQFFCLSIGWPHSLRTIKTKKK